MTNQLKSVIIRRRHETTLFDGTKLVSHAVTKYNSLRQITSERTYYYVNGKTVTTQAFWDAMYGDASSVPQPEIPVLTNEVVDGEVVPLELKSKLLIDAAKAKIYGGTPHSSWAGQPYQD